ncbi:hypothetical protein I6A84_34695 [Frankia sp. CNm7]|uniref:Uncharacterized protein n=1 Tax=Frankia nepalensis TaxID=1836974 RepID=A0A937RT90_9ACTN|nr:hypothetical protein [Frankia nepalensis]MBL7495125.1 hypothetical protein [Frankia nepalensis]MBL7515429.1 hypothetical protein [Frankia nepalensis]MBL7523097.1 hypothetical protein [Frankia nepalensis]MBL7632363.1 hypothetical protein [Frankia nepalensis]
MGEFFSDFFGFLIFSPLTAVVFGFGIWILPAVFLRDTVARLRLRFFHFFVSGYVFIAIMTIYLLVVGSSQDGGGRHHKAGPFLGMIASLAMAWGLNRLLRRRFPELFDRLRLTGGKTPGTAPTPHHAGGQHPGYAHPGYGPGGYPGHPQHPGYQHPGYPGYPQPQPQPMPQPQPPPEAGGTGGQPPRTPGVPWVVPPPGPGATPPPSPPD